MCVLMYVCPGPQFGGRVSESQPPASPGLWQVLAEFYVIQSTDKYGAYEMSLSPESLCNTIKADALMERLPKGGRGGLIIRMI